MATVTAERVSAEMDGEFVVFLIGIRINRIWKIHKWLPVLRARKKMLAELLAHPESGCMSHNKSGGIAVLYWRTFEQLEYLARGAAKELWPAWTKFNEKLEQSAGDLDVWHEVYVIKPGQYEAIYSGTRAMGLSKVGHLVPWSLPNAHPGDRLKAEVA
jgi:hypothetical protein